MKNTIVSLVCLVLCSIFLGISWHYKNISEEAQDVCENINTTKTITYNSSAEGKFKSLEEFAFEELPCADSKRAELTAKCELENEIKKQSNDLLELRKNKLTLKEIATWNTYDCDGLHKEQIYYCDFSSLKFTAVNYNENCTRIYSGGYIFNYPNGTNDKDRQIECLTLKYKMGYPTTKDDLEKI